MRRAENDLTRRASHTDCQLERCLEVYENVHAEISLHKFTATFRSGIITTVSIS